MYSKIQVSSLSLFNLRISTYVKSNQYSVRLPRCHFWFSVKTTYFHDSRRVEVSYALGRRVHTHMCCQLLLQKWYNYTGRIRHSISLNPWLLNCVQSCLYHSPTVTLEIIQVLPKLRNESSSYYTIIIGATFTYSGNAYTMRNRMKK